MNNLMRALKPQACPLDTDAIADLLHMYHNVPAIKVARESFLSMTLCGPFTFSIPKLALNSNTDMSMIITRYWMPWLRTVYDWIKLFGVCPYYMKAAPGRKEHMVPVVPSIKLGYMTVTPNEKHEVTFQWYWNHGYEQSEATNMYWITSDHAPEPDGTIRSPLASLLTQYRTILVLQRNLEKVSTQRADPPHILEYHPAAGTAKNDDLTQLVANFGERASGQSKARQEQARAQEIRIRTAELFRQTQAVHDSNMSAGMATHRKTLWTDTPADVLDRLDSGFASRVVPLRPDFKYVQASQPAVVAELDKHMHSFNMIASAVMDFALELIQPTGSARTQNVQGSERFENERIKEALNFFTGITQAAIVVAYRKQFEQGFEQARTWKAEHHGARAKTSSGDPFVIAEMYPELDVQVDMSCTPMMTYADLREMWTDGILSKDHFAHHAFHMRSLPHDQISVTMYPDKMPKEAAEAMMGVKRKPDGGGGSVPKKKKAKAPGTAT